MNDDVEKKEHEPREISAGLAFSGLANVRNMEAQLRWQGFQTATQLNLLGLVGTILWMLQDRTKPDLILVFLGCLVFVFWNVFHYKILGRDGKFMGLWNEKLIELENVNGVDGGVKIFSSSRYDVLRNREPTLQFMLRSGIVFFTVSWVIVGLVSSFALLFG